MNNLARTATLAEPEDREEEALLVEQLPFVLKKLRPRHKDVCALVAQGLPRGQVAQICDYTPEYVSALMRQPVCIAYITEMNEAVGHQLEAMYGKAVGVIANAMENGKVAEQLTAVRLHGELTKRIGPRAEGGLSNINSDARLIELASRLTGLLETAKHGTQTGRTIEGYATEVQGSASVRRDEVLGIGQAEARSDEALG